MFPLWPITVAVWSKAECTLARCGRRYSKRYDTRCDTNATCIARKHRKCTEAAKQVHTDTIAIRQRHLSASYHSRGHGVLVFYAQCLSTQGKRNMTGTQEDILPMISFIKLVETNICLWNFTLKSYFRTDFTSLAWRPLPKCV
jgi:hypothetical protein